MLNLSAGFTEEQHKVQFNSWTGTATEIIHHIDEIYSILAKAAIPARPYTRKALQTLSIANEDKKLRILQDLKNWKAILVASNVSFDNVDELNLASKALNHFNFRLKKHDWQDVCQNQIIEIYNPQGIQLYRSLNFFNTCGYSLLDLCVTEWFVLWERPTSIINRIHAIVNDVMTGNFLGGDVGIGSHLIRETYDDGSTQPFLPRTALVEFGSIYPAYCGSDYKTITGFIITSRGKLVSVGEEAANVDFI